MADTPRPGRDWENHPAITLTQGRHDRLARRLSRHPAGHEVILVTADDSGGSWAEEGVRVVPLPAKFSEVVGLARSEGVDLAVNYNPVYGVAGFYEALEAAGVAVVGSNQKLSVTEIHKQQFKDWLVQNGFRTPRPLHRGRWEDIRGHAANLKYPVVIDGSPFRSATGFDHRFDEIETLNSYAAAFPR